MMNSLTDLQTLLADLPPRVRDVKGAMVVTLDGRVLANCAVATRSSQIAAMASSSLALGTRVVETIEGGQLNEVAISGSDGNILIYAIGKKAVLVVITSKAPNVALINWEARKVTAEMTALLS